MENEKKGARVTFQWTGGKEGVGRLVRSNQNTVVVEIANDPERGGGISVIKRHRKRHSVCVEDTLIERTELETQTTPVDEGGSESSDEEAISTTEGEAAGA